ncbi:uncharacterized protein ACO6RY_05879 [Pungitius sinensis]
MRPAMTIEEIPKERIAQPKRRRKEGARRPMSIKVHTKYDRQAAVRHHNVFRAAALTPGSPARKSSHISQFHSQRYSARTMKTNEHWNFNSLPKRTEKQHPSKAASGVRDGAGFQAEKQLLVENTGSIRRPQPQKEDDKVDVNGDTIPHRAESRRQGRGSGTDASQTNTNGNGNQERLAHIPRADFVLKTDDNDGKQVSTEAVEEAFMMLFLPEWETQTEPWSRLGADPVKTTVKLLYRHPPTTTVIKTRFIMEAGSLKGVLFLLEVCVPDGTERKALKPAERRVTTASAYAGERVTKTAPTDANDSPGANRGTTPTERESVTPPPPTLKATGRRAETPASTGAAEAHADARPRFIKCIGGNRGAPTRGSLSGLRMRQDVPAETTTAGAGTRGRGAADRTGSDRKGFQDDPKENSVTFNAIQNTGDDDAPCCGGLVHRSEADGSVPPGSKMVPRDAPREAGEQARRPPRDHPLEEDEYEHFYYFDGVLRRVRNNLYPHQERERRRKGSRGDSQNSVFGVRNKGDTKENFLRYIRRRTSGNKASDLK